jgi:hypothetical protein
MAGMQEYADSVGVWDVRAQNIQAMDTLGIEQTVR